MKALLVVLLAVSALAYTEKEYQDSFVSWMKQFDRHYEASEFFHRYGIFKSTMDRIAAHNAMNLSWTSGLNQFSDMTNAEFAAQGHGYIPYGKPITTPDWPATPGPDSYPNGALDWSNAAANPLGKNAVTGVKNQGQCGSCWAFSTTGSVEGWVVTYEAGPLTSLSEQELVSCSSAYGNQGCNGGMYTNAGQYINKYGDDTESAYPYADSAGTAIKCACTNQGGTNPCTASTDTLKLAAITMFTGETNIGNHCNTQPVSVAIQANQPAFQDYKSGTFCASTCGTNLDHAVLVVGWGTDSTGVDYWKVKNSWGTTWGEQGYILMCRNQNICGIGKEPGYAHA